MKRHLKLYRDILLYVEEHGDPRRTQMYFRAEEETPDLSEWPAEIVAGHADVMVKAGFLEGGTQTSMNGGIIAVGVNGLTHEGYDFLDDLRNETVFRKTMGKVGEVLGTASLATVKAVAQGVTEAMMKDAV